MKAKGNPDLVVEAIISVLSEFEAEQITDAAASGAMRSQLLAGLTSLGKLFCLDVRMLQLEWEDTNGKNYSLHS